jgi:hypothetical protein
MKSLFTAAVAALLIFQTAMAQPDAPGPDAQLKKALAEIELLAGKVAAQEARIEELEVARTRPVSPAGGDVRMIPAAFVPDAPAMPAAMPMPASAGGRGQRRGDQPYRRAAFRCQPLRGSA